MPAENKKFNPSLGPIFPAKTGSGHYVGTPITAETLQVLRTKVLIGDTPIAKKAPRPNKNGEEYFFLEFMPPRQNNNDRV